MRFLRDRGGPLSEELKGIGPEAFTNAEETVISFKGSNFYRACDAFVRNRPEGGASYCIRQMGHEDNNHIDFSGHSTKETTYIGGEEPASAALIFPIIEDGAKDNPVPTDGYSEDAGTKFNPNGEVMVTLNVSCKSRGEVDEAMDVLLSPLVHLARKDGASVALSLYDSRDY
jgi:hypothetical protein